MNASRTTLGGYRPLVRRRALLFLLLSLLISGLTACGGGGAGGGGGSQTPPPPPPSTANLKYLRTDATTEYFEWLNQHWIIYHAGTGRYFVTDPSSSQVIVVDAASQKKIASLSVPGAFAIDLTPDQSLLYVGTLIGDVYSIDPLGMTVTNRYLASQIGPNGFYANTALVLANGQLALAGGPSAPLLGQTPVIAIWNPSDNAFTIYGVDPAFPLPCPSNGPMGAITLSADRTQIIFGSPEICEMDPSTGTGIYSNVSFLNHIVVTPDGKYVIAPSYALTQDPSVAVVLDAHTLATVAQFNVLGDTSSAAGFFVSADSTTLFTPGDPETAIIYAYNLGTQQLVGWVPNISVQNTSGGGALGPISSPYLLATDGTGVFAGPLEEGIGSVDLSVLQTGPVGTQFENAYAEPLSPPTGPIGGGTATQWSDGAPIGTLGSVYFGSGQAADVSTSPDDPYPFVGILATSPSGSAGPVDVYAFTTDGGTQLLPEVFSYGPTILEVTPNMATEGGGGTGIVYGYGFGPINSSTIPSDLQFTVGGAPAEITGFGGNAYDLAYPPFPLQAFAYTIPPNASGSVVSVSVSTNSGSTSKSGGLSYLPSIQQFPLTGSTLAQGIYDSYTGLYYFTDTNKIQVFSRSQGKWLSPINIPAPNGATQRLWGIALSPDGNNLAVSDANAGAIYILNPASPTSVETFIVGSQSPTTNPCGLAISDAGNVYYMVIPPDGYSGFDQFFKLNTNTGTIFNYGIDGPGSPATDAYLRNVISSDNSRVFYNEEGYVFYVDTATDKLFPAPGYLSPCCYGNYDLALSSNQARFEGTGYFYDFNLNAESFYTQDDREILNIAYVYGAKLSRDGRLSFQPSTNGIDVFDGELGNLLNRISLPVALSPNYDALVDDGTDNILVAITGTGDGIAIVDLTSISEPPPLPYNRKSALRQYRSSRQLSSPDNANPPAVQKQPVQHSHVVRYVTNSVLPYRK
jgi:DNA-binding beta-propeller fold protein YncE